MNEARANRTNNGRVGRRSIRQAPEVLRRQLTHSRTRIHLELKTWNLMSPPHPGRVYDRIIHTGIVEKDIYSVILLRIKKTQAEPMVAGF